MVRPLKAAMVFSTKPDSFRVSVWMATWTSISSATERQVSMALGVVPQSSCSLRPQAPAATCSSRESGREALPLPKKPRFMGRPSAACSMRAMCQGPGVQGGGVGALGRAGAAAEHGGDAGIEGVVNLLRTNPVDMRIDAAGGDDAALAGDGLGAGADDDVDVRLNVGVAGLADGGDLAVPDADVGLDDAPVVDDQGVGDDRIHGALGLRGLGLAHAVADHLAAAELDLLAVGGAVLLDLDDEIGIGKADLVADGRAEHGRIGGAINAIRHSLISLDMGHE